MNDKGFTGSTFCHKIIDIHSRQCATGTSTVKFHVFFCVIVSVVGGARLSARCTCAGIVVVDCNTKKSIDCGFGPFCQGISSQCFEKVQSSEKEEISSLLNQSV